VVTREFRGSVTVPTAPKCRADEAPALESSLENLSNGNAAAYIVANGDRLAHFLADARVPRENGWSLSVRMLGGLSTDGIGRGSLMGATRVA